MYMFSKQRSPLGLLHCWNEHSSSTDGFTVVKGSSTAHNCTHCWAPAGRPQPSCSYWQIPLGPLRQVRWQRKHARCAREVEQDRARGGRQQDWKGRIRTAKGLILLLLTSSKLLTAHLRAPMIPLDRPIWTCTSEFTHTGPSRPLCTAQSAPLLQVAARLGGE